MIDKTLIGLNQVFFTKERIETASLIIQKVGVVILCKRAKGRGEDII